MKRLVITSAILLICSYAFADGLDTLIELAGAKARASRIAEEETRSYENIKKAIEKGSVSMGQPKDVVRRKFGAPVIEFQKEKNKKETWVYKPGTESFFDGPKVYLVFDEAGSLDEIKTVEKKIGKREEGRKKDEMPVLQKPERRRHRL